MSAERPAAVRSSTDSATMTLRRLMAAADIPSFRALARQAGVSSWAIQQVRRDRLLTMRLETLHRLASALKLPLPELLAALGAIATSPPDSTSSGVTQSQVAALRAEYERLQTHLAHQETSLRQQFQREVLTVIEPWLLQWPTVTHAVAQNPDLPASRLVPLVTPLQNLLEQWGITAIAPVGTEVPYDPHLHQLMQGTAVPGEPVRVRYAGYQQGDTLLFRAKVSPVG